jgi:hypothetical protein
MIKHALAACIVLAAPSLAWAQEADRLAQQLSNPIADLISVPIQSNFDFAAGADNEGFGFTANVQPVVPLPINDGWTVISRTILPIAYRDYLPTPDDDTFGLGDITQSLFFSPKQSGVEGLTWGAGPAFLVPIATDDVLGAGKWGVGPTAIVLQQTGPWTVGALANHIWSVAGDDDREDVSATFLQPFAAYALGGGRTVSLNAESSYDWEHEQWTLPVNVSYSQVFAVGGRHMSWALGGKYYVDGPEAAPQWGLRTTLTFVFPGAAS